MNNPLKELFCFSNPRTPLEDSFFGFQVDKLMNAIPGEARIKIAVYDHEEGQVRDKPSNLFHLSVSQFIWYVI